VFVMMIDTRHKRQFWKLVLRCLTDLLDMPSEEADRRVRDMRDLIEDAPVSVDSDMIYHAEPLHIAMRLKFGGSLTAQAYQEVLARYHDGYQRLQASLHP
jgi:hypothetical protein